MAVEWGVRVRDGVETGLDVAEHRGDIGAVDGTGRLQKYVVQMVLSRVAVSLFVQTSSNVSILISVGNAPENTQPVKKAILLCATNSRPSFPAKRQK
jgi:hypothetical protein